MSRAATTEAGRHAAARRDDAQVICANSPASRRRASLDATLRERDGPRLACWRPLLSRPGRHANRLCQLRASDLPLTCKLLVEGIGA